MTPRLCQRLTASFAITLACAAPRAGTVVDNRLLADERDGANWASYGRTFSENHYSPLREINADNVAPRGSSREPGQLSELAPWLHPSGCAAGLQQPLSPVDQRKGRAPPSQPEGVHFKMHKG